MNRSTKRGILKVGRFSCIVGATVFFAFPIYWMFVTSFKTRLDMFAIPPKWIFTPTLENYLDVFLKVHYTLYGLTPTPTDFDRFLFNSVVISLSSVALSVLFGTLAAYSFSRFSMKGKDTWLFFILATRMLPPIAVLVPMFLMYRALGLMNTHIGLILLYTMFNLSFSVWMMKGFIDEVPREFEEAAMVDGYPRFRSFIKATLPQILSGMAATAVFVFITSWNEFVFAYVTSGFESRTVPVSLARIRGESGINWGLITASEVIYLAPVIIFTFLTQKYLLRGVTFGTIRR